METSRDTDVPLIAIQIGFRLLARNEQVGEDIGDAEELVTFVRGREDDNKSGLVEVRREGGVHLYEGGPSGLPTGDGGPVGEVECKVGGVVGVLGERGCLKGAAVEVFFVLEHPSHDWVFLQAGLPAFADLYIGGNCGVGCHC